MTVCHKGEYYVNYLPCYKDSHTIKFILNEHKIKTLLINKITLFFDE